MQTDEECNKMIEKWLKKNKPSIQIKENEPMPHVTPSGGLGINGRADEGGTYVN